MYSHEVIIQRRIPFPHPTDGAINIVLEKGHLLESHLLEKTARHQNLDCSTLFEQMTKIYASARKLKKYAVHV
jgi:hypothetical protein